MATDKRIGFIGAGQMAEALARGFISKGVVKAENIFATDPMAERKEVFRSFKTNPVDSNIEVRCTHCTPALGLLAGAQPGAAVRATPPRSPRPPPALRWSPRATWCSWR
jgi:hypothetical protein